MVEGPIHTNVYHTPALVEESQNEVLYGIGEDCNWSVEHTLHPGTLLLQQLWKEQYPNLSLKIRLYSLKFKPMPYYLLSSQVVASFLLVC